MLDKRIKYVLNKPDSEYKLNNNKRGHHAYVKWHVYKLGEEWPEFRFGKADGNTPLEALNNAIKVAEER